MKNHFGEVFDFSSASISRFSCADICRDLSITASIVSGVSPKTASNCSRSMFTPCSFVPMVSTRKMKREILNGYLGKFLGWVFACFSRSSRCFRNIFIFSIARSNVSGVSPNTASNCSRSMFSPCSFVPMIPPRTQINYTIKTRRYASRVVQGGAIAGV